MQIYMNRQTHKYILEGFTNYISTFITHISRGVCQLARPKYFGAQILNWSDGTTQSFDDFPFQILFSVFSWPMLVKFRVPNMHMVKYSWQQCISKNTPILDLQLRVMVLPSITSFSYLNSCTNLLAEKKSHAQKLYSLTYPTDQKKKKKKNSKGKRAMYMTYMHMIICIIVETWKPKPYPNECSHLYFV